jgi:nanoRNase/pAp phosphatase (c-di-AMP/oligoRNAs hydrolase)
VAEGFGGKGGGHNIAAGAQVPVGSLDVFLRSVDELVKKQLAGG